MLNNNSPAHINGCRFVRTDDHISNSVVFTWQLISDPKRYYRVKIDMYNFRKLDDFHRILMEHREKALSQLSVSKYPVDNDPNPPPKPF